MKKSNVAIAAALCFVSVAEAQKIDFDFAGRNNVTADGHTAWTVATEKTSSLSVDGISFKLTAGGAANGFRSQWNKNDVTAKSLLLTGDAAVCFYIDSDNNTSNITNKSVSTILTISGLSAGKHSILAYHNGVNGYSNIAPIQISVDGNTVINSLKQSENAATLEEAAFSYISFNASSGKDVVIEFKSIVESGKSYGSTLVYLNGFQIDVANTNDQAQAPKPAAGDMHAVPYNNDDNKVQLSWTGASNAVKHHVYFGTSPLDLQLVSTTSGTSYLAENLSAINTYYWRIDEETANGVVTEGDVWSFRPRHLAFPGAEGWGKYAIGGRGGVVYHVTNLEDNGNDDNPIPGSFRYGIKKISGPRTIVFDVAGVISLKSRLSCGDPYVTIAGQTAPGNGIMLRTCPFGMANDGITRFLRMRLGHKRTINGVIPKNANDYGSDAGAYPETTLGGVDGLGMAGNDNSIMDHCSISWTIDEGFSSRNAHSVTLQRTLISEALNVAGHPNYKSGTGHGYAATIGGGEMSEEPSAGSFHHNLLAHNAGRNWSLSGGLDGAGYYDGHHDVFNNVVYNWESRATDGGTHELNFVNNFYKMGASTTMTYILRHQFEGTGKGSQSAYVKGNVRQATNNGSISEDSKGSQDDNSTVHTYRYELTGGQTLNWDPWASKPYFESLANIETARAAYKNVLSDVGANQPFFDPHDKRMVKETLNGKTSTKGSRSGMAGLIDSEEDNGCEGFNKLEMYEASRDADFDTDQDGMPDWWEKATGSNPSFADNNDDPDGDGYTLLEDYLNYMALPHFEDEQNIDLTQYFAGYNNSPSFRLISNTDNMEAGVSNGYLKVSFKGGSQALGNVVVEATDADGWGSLQRTFNFYFTKAETTGLQEVESEKASAADNGPAYDIYGRKVTDRSRGVVVKKGKKALNRK